MLKILDKNSGRENDLEIKEKYASLYKEIGVCQSVYVKDYKTALTYFRKSLDVSEEIHALLPSYPLEDRKISIYNNIGSIYIYINSFDSAKIYYQQALQHAENRIDPPRLASLYNYLGIVSSELENYNEAYKYFDEALKLYQETNDSASMANVYLNIGICQFQLENYSDAVLELNKALECVKKGSDPNVEILITKALAGSYEKLEEYEKSNQMFKQADILKDSVSNIEKLKNSVQSELQYRFEKQENEKELQQQIILARKERTILVYVLIAILLLMALFLLLLLYRNQRVKSKHIRLEQESLSLQNENLGLKNQQLEQNLEYKKKELDMQLMYLLQKKEFVSSIIDQILEVKEKDPSKMKSLVNNLKNDMEDSVSKEFKILFQELHKDFYNNLYSKHPNLTPNEKKLCAFIRLNMSSKDISSITFQSVKSIEIARSRLRARMNLDRKDNLTLYLQQF